MITLDKQVTVFIVFILSYSVNYIDLLMHRDLYLMKAIYSGFHRSLSPHIKFFGVIEPFNFTTSGAHFEEMDFFYK